MKYSALLSDTIILSSKGQLVVPRLLRLKLGIHAGMKLFLTVRSDGILEIKPMRHSIDLFFGCCKHGIKEKPISVKEMDEAIMKAVTE